MRPAFLAAALLIGSTAVLQAQPCALDAGLPRLPDVAAAPETRAVMDALLTAAGQALPQAAKSSSGRSVPAPALLGELMFDRVDMVASTAAFARPDLLPYAHQFRGDMMEAPWTVQLGWLNGAPLLVSANRRPGAPPALPILEFLRVALAPAGQRALAQAGGAPLEQPLLDQQTAKLDAFVPPLDPALPPPRAALQQAAGPIRSVGSDGMKSLMDSWMCRLHAVAPAIYAGFPWEHLGTLNGWNALLVGAADAAPMGRELWPQELRDWRAVFPSAPPPVEIMVARGGFDTPQRTTAQAIFVNRANPLRAISVAQLSDVLSGRIQRWGDLGLAGAWADRPIHVFTPPLTAPNAMSMQNMVLDGAPWRPDAVSGTIAATAQAIHDDAAAIGFGGKEEGTPDLAVLAIVPRGGGDPVPLDAATAASGRYPLTRGMFVRMPPGPPPPALAALLDLALSRDGQARVVASAYFPLDAAEAAHERAKLDALLKRKTTP